MRYLLGISIAMFIGGIIGWASCLLVSRERLKRSVLRQRAAEIPTEDIQTAWKKEL